MLWIAAISFFLAGVCVGVLVGVRYGFADGYLRGIKKQVSVDDLLELFDEADREVFGSDGPPPERPEVTD